MSDHLRTLAKGLLGVAIATLVLTGALLVGIVTGSALSGIEVTPTASAPSPIPSRPQDVSAADYEAFEIFWEVWTLVEANFYGTFPSTDDIDYAATHGMLGTLGDDYTSLIEPELAAILAEDASGSYEGIGAFVTLDQNGLVEITGLFESGPSEIAGLLPGDKVLEVDSVSVVGLTLYQAIANIRGPAGSEVTLLVSRAGVAEHFGVTVTRARLEIPIVEEEVLEDSIGYVRLADFSATATASVEEALDKLLAGGVQGIVFDLRNNPGGWLDQAVDVSDLFLSSGVIVTEKWSDGRELSDYAQPGDVGEEVMLVVLVNGHTASAAEIVAGALQDYQRAILIGQTTYGKGSVQRTFTLEDGSELRVTSARWFTPDGDAIGGAGLTPDIHVSAVDRADPEADPQLDRAVEYLLTGE
ncbi:MAG: S41 family peptidase, partial [Anaerolineales bacterium]